MSQDTGGAPGAATRGVAGAATRGVLWTGAAAAATKVVTFAGTLVLARLLDREAFGVAAYALSIVSLLEVLRGLGVSQALIYFPRDPGRSDTGFWIMAANGVGLSLLALALAPAAGAFFHDPRAVAVVATLAAYFPLLSLGQVPDVELRRDLRFGRRVLPEVARAVLKTAAALTLAFAGAGYWSLVLAQIVGAAAWTATLYAVQPWRPRLGFDRGEARRLLGYGRHMVVVMLLAAVAMRADQLAVGRFLGAAALGVYTIAFSLPALLLQASSGLSQVLFPAYARLAGDPARLRSAALRTLKLAAVAFAPAGVGIALLAEPIVVVGFGGQWREAVPVLAWMGPWAALMAITQHLNEVYKAAGEARTLARLTAVTTALQVPGVVWAAARGDSLVDVVMVLIAVRAVRVVLDLVAVSRLVGLEPRAALAAVAPALAASTAMGAVVWGLCAATADLPALPRLAILTVAGAAVHCVAVALLDRGLVSEVRGLVLAAVARGADPGAGPEPGTAAGLS